MQTNKKITSRRGRRNEEKTQERFSNFSSGCSLSSGAVPAAGRAAPTWCAPAWSETAPAARPSSSRPHLSTAEISSLDFIWQSEVFDTAARDGNHRPAENWSDRTREEFYFSSILTLFTFYYITTANRHMFFVEFMRLPNEEQCRILKWKRNNTWFSKCLKIQLHEKGNTYWATYII